MKVLISLGLALALFSPARAGSADKTDNDPRAVELMKRIDDLWRGDSSRARMTMNVKTDRYERSLEMEAWSLGTKHSLVKILNPKKERGTATLKADHNIYTYLPKTDRTIKLSSGMMGGSWMGSHFTNDDLVAESRMSEDYRITVSFEGERNGEKITELTLLPRATAAVVWGKIVMAVQSDSLLPVRADYFDEEMELARSMTYHDVKVFDGRSMPARMRLVPADQAGEYTELIYQELQFNIDIDESFFSLNRLKKRN